MMRAIYQNGCGGSKRLLTPWTGTPVHGNGTPGRGSGRRTGDVFVGSGATPLMAST